MTNLARAAARDAGIRAGIPADVVDKMLDRGFVLIDKPGIVVAFRLVIEDKERTGGNLGLPPESTDRTASHQEEG